LSLLHLLPISPLEFESERDFLSYEFYPNKARYTLLLKAKTEAQIGKPRKKTNSPEGKRNKAREKGGAMAVARKYTGVVVLIKVVS